MLVIVRSMKELSFGKLMEVYIEGNRNTAAECYSYLPAGQGLIRAEQDFYNYLRAGFFQTPGAVYCIWQEGNSYVSALRLEPYRDGMLLAALETAPECRNQGYAASLIQSVQSWLNGQGSVRIYSHISNDNVPSVAVHERCGFIRELDYAVYADGSVSRRAGTYVFDCSQSL